MTKRMFALLAALLLVLVALAAGCGGGEDDEGDTAAGPQKNVTLTFWNGFTGPDRPALEEIVRRFNASHPKIKVRMQIMPWDTFFQKLLPIYASGKGPVIAGMASEQMPQYADKGVIQPLDDLYETGGLNKNTLVSSAV